MIKRAILASSFVGSMAACSLDPDVNPAQRCAADHDCPEAQLCHAGFCIGTEPSAQHDDPASELDAGPQDAGQSQPPADDGSSDDGSSDDAATPDDPPPVADPPPHDPGDDDDDRICVAGVCCELGLTPVSGICCKADELSCDGECINPDKDKHHCGECNHECSHGPCKDGMCREDP